MSGIFSYAADVVSILYGKIVPSPSPLLPLRSQGPVPQTPRPMIDIPAESFHIPIKLRRSDRLAAKKVERMLV